MLAKVLVLTFVAAVFCEEHGYNLRNHHEQAKEYRQHYEHIPIRLQEEQGASQEVQYGQAPEGHGNGGQAYSSQSIIHHTGPVDQQESQESHNEHVAPVYQYVQEEEEAPARHEAPVHREAAQHYQTIQYVPAPAHHEEESHASVQGHAQPQYAQVHEGLSYQQGGNAYKGSSFHHGAQLHTSVHAPAPYRHAEPVPIHHAVPVQHEEPVHHAVPVHAHETHDEPIDYYAYPKYQYEYKVEDPHTGDNKFQHEIRDGDVVKGVYSLLEADGSYRTVEYSSDKHTGFNAIVKHSAPGQHVQIKSHHHN